MYLNICLYAVINSSLDAAFSLNYATFASIYKTITMENKTPDIYRIARTCGLFMGLYYIIRLACIPFSMIFPGINALFLLMIIAAPFLVGYMTKIMRERVLKGSLTFVQGFNFSLIIIICGTLIESLSMYIYFRFFDKGRVVQLMDESIAETIQNAGENELTEYMMANRDIFAASAPIDIAISTLVSGLIWAVIISLIIGVLLRKQKFPYQY